MYIIIIDFTTQKHKYEGKRKIQLMLCWRIAAHQECYHLTNNTYNYTQKQFTSANMHNMDINNEKNKQNQD